MRTMKIMKQMMSLAAAILALSACSESEDILSAYHNDPNAVHITAEVGKASADGFTRSNPLGATEADQKKFNENDEISVKADGQEAVTYKFNGTEWIPQDSKFLKWESETMNFTAFYPATFNGTITQPTEYTSEADLAANDFMSYSDKQSNTNGNQLTLTMNRQMARVVVEIVKFNDQYASGTTVNSVTINGVKAYKHDDGKFYALIKPCSNQADQEFLSLKVGEGNTETYTGIPALEAGKSYTYQLTVGKNKVVVTGITVADWTSGTTLDGKTTYIPYVNFTAKGKLKFKLMNNGYFPTNIEYSVGTGDWKTLEDGHDPIPFGGALGSLQLRGTNNLKGTSNYSPFNNNGSRIYFSSFSEEEDIKVACTGDIRTLLDYKTYKTVSTSTAQFYQLFYLCDKLTSAPDLPATTLADDCYYEMFGGCTSLTKAPALPAQELATRCYINMFSGCTSLQEAPKLSATKLAFGCYQGMFEGCSKLQEAPELPATTLADYCYCYMFQNCTNLSSVKMLAPNDQITNKQSCCDSWLNNAGADPTVTSRKLILKDVDAYYALVDKGYLPDNWKKGECNVLDGTPYVTFSAAEAQTFKLENNGYFPNNIEYSVGTDDWKTLEANKEIPFGGDKGNLQLRGTNSKGTASSRAEYSTISFTNTEVKVACTGDIRTLLDYKAYKTVDTSNARFCLLFKNCTALTSAPDLPATTLAEYCYYSMFNSCSSLKVAPALPATTLAASCYENMFICCSNLQEAPELPATNLTNSCYYSMFERCSSLKKAPALPAQTLESVCYTSMFNGCTNLSSVTMLAPSNQILGDRFTKWLLNAGKGATSRTLIVKDEAAYDALVSKGYLPADYWQIGKCTILDETGFDLGIPYLTFTANAAQTFKMATTGSYAISGLQYSVNHGTWTDVVAGGEGVTFGGDKGNLRLRGTNTNGTATNDNIYSTIKFTDDNVKVACTGDIRTLLDWRNYATVATDHARFCYLFSGCNVLTSAPELPAKTLADYCYSNMFSYCTSLESAPKMSAERLAQNCCEYMFRNCTSLTSAPELSATELAYGCYAGMFQRCTSLTSAPKLPATKLEDQCYVFMFSGCSNLSTVTMLALGSEITSNLARVKGWLYQAGTDATSRTLKIQDKAAYEALKANTNYLPAQWQKGYEGTTVLNASNNPIE